MAAVFACAGVLNNAVAAALNAQQPIRMDFRNFPERLALLAIPEDLPLIAFGASRLKFEAA